MHPYPSVPHLYPSPTRKKNGNPDAGSEDDDGRTRAEGSEDGRRRSSGDRVAIEARSAGPASLATCYPCESVSICGSLRACARSPSASIRSKATVETRPHFRHAVPVSSFKFQVQRPALSLIRKISVRAHARSGESGITKRQTPMNSNANSNSDDGELTL
jgi:hypothetical protein